jgi:hypothetical protein
LFEAVGDLQNGKLNMEIKVTIFTTDILYNCLRTKNNDLSEERYWEVQ